MRPTTFRLLRLHFDISQRTMAHAIGVSPSALCQWEGGRENAIAPWKILPLSDEMGDALLCEQPRSEYS